jgi:hypothetical protein
MSEFKKNFPLLARHEGIWDGMYRYFDAAGHKTDEHSSRLVCRLHDTRTAAGFDYEQSNFYKWADGRTDIRPFPARTEGDRIVFVSDLIDGWAAAVPLDEAKRTMMLHWVRKGEPGVYLYEMIQISDDGKYRSRVWHWFREGRLFQRTLIDEEKVSPNWRQVTGPTFAGDVLVD